MWKYSDVRLLDSVDSLDPNQDLIALYTRIISNSFQIRIDFLDLVSSIDQDVYIPIDTNPGGSNQIRTKNNELIQADIYWDYLIIYSKYGDIQIVNSDYFPLDNIEIFILINSFQDNIILSIDKKSLPAVTSLTRIQVIVTPPNKAHITDQIGPVSIDGPSHSRSKVLFVFWDTFYSSTPAEALRSWAGAHSGPMSNRHGLKYLLDFADKTHNTIFLLDILKPESLSALDYLGVDDWVQNLIKQRKVITNDKKSISLVNEIKSLCIDKNFGVGVNDYAQYFSNYQTCFQLLGISPEPTVFLDLFIRCKSLLISNGLYNSSNPIILGGNFQSSLLGDPTTLNSINSYISNHPWIQVLTQNDVQTSMGFLKIKPVPQKYNNINVKNIFSSQLVSEDKYTFSQIKQDVYLALLSAPENQLTDLAWQIFETLSYPEATELIQLGENYIGQIGYVLAAARWVNQPEAISSCTTDLDFDKEMECVLANNHIFMIIEPNGAYVPFIFSKDEQGAHQIVGPTWEFMLGISDPSTWDLSLGVRSDSAQILGAFVDDFNKLDNSEIILLNNRITFNNETMSIRKSFAITENDVIFEISNKSLPQKGSQLPLVLDPWTRYSNDWGDKYINQITSNGIVWKIDSGKFIEIHSNNQITIIPFNATHSALAKPEDPNFDYGFGHYLPFPIALLEIQPATFYQIDIVVNP